MTLPANMLDLYVSVFMVGLTPPSMGSGIFLMSANGDWTPFTTCVSAPAAYMGKLNAPLPLHIVSSPTDLSALAGTSFYVGYGMGMTTADSCIDMLNRSTFTQAHTIK